MIELELLASKAAVAHILGRDAEGLYQSDSKPGDLAARICSLLSRAYLDGVWVTTQRRVEIPGDTQIRIRAVADQLARRAGAQSLPDLWPVVREWMEEQVGGEHAPDFRTIRNGRTLAIDPVFFSMAPQQLPDSWMPEAAEGDAHVHVGGAVAWDSLWTWLMNRDYPPACMARVKYRWLDRSADAVRLLKRARECRKDLLQEHGLWEHRRRDPACDSILFRRLRAGGAVDGEEVRDYVLVRCMMRREMLCDSVADLDEFTGAAWRRYWGNKGKGAVSAGIIRRQLRVEARKFEAAVREVVDRHGVGRVSFRMNLEPKKYLASRALKTAASVLPAQTHRQAGTGEGREVALGLVIHGRRPKTRRTSAGGPAQNDRLLGRLKRLFCYLHPRKGEARKFVDPKTVSFDLTGPEKGTPNSWFSEALKALVNNRKGRGLSIHAGEDFYDPWHGLWRVHEAARRMGREPRIGHGSILGINPYALRWARYTCPVWVRRESLEDAETLLKQCKNPRPPEDWQQILDKLLRLLPTNRDRDAVIEVIPEDWEQNLFFFAQKHLVTRLAQNGALVETNPTSNLAILNAPGYEWAPVWGLCAAEGLRVLMGTDDPGLLNTCIEEEYARLAEAFERRKELEKSPESPIRWHLRVTRSIEHWRDLEARLRSHTRSFALIGQPLAAAVRRASSR